MMEKRSINTVHQCAAMSAMLVGAVEIKHPAGADIIILAAGEVLLVIYVASMFGYSLSKRIAIQALIAGIWSTFVGLAILDCLNISEPFIYFSKMLAAIGITDVLGVASYKFYENGGIL